MEGIRFYEEFENKRKGISNGNVVAVIHENNWYRQDATGRLQLLYEAIGAVYFYPNSPVCGTGVSQEYLWSTCKRVSESKAREIHPELFTVLDKPD